jgi:hypothetical protein
MVTWYGGIRAVMPLHGTGGECKSGYRASHDLHAKGST